MNMKLKELFFLHFLNDGFRTIYILILPFIAKDLVLNYTQAGLLGSILNLIAGLLAIPAGFTASKIGGYKMLISLLAIYSLGTLSIGFSPNLTILTLAYLLGALGFGMFHTTSFIMVAKLSDKKNIGRNLGEYTSVGEIGRIALPPLAVFAVSLIGWRTTMLTAAFLGFLTFIVFRFLIPKKDIYHLETDAEKKENHKDFAKQLINLFKIKKTILAVIAAIIDSFASTPVYIYLPFLVLAKGFNPIELGVISAGLFTGSLSGKIILGRISDKLGNTKVFIISELLMAIVLVLITFFPLL